MCPSEDRCLECDWGLRQRRQPASVCHLCGCSPTTGFDYLLLLECEIWICLFITQSWARVGAWATADDCCCWLFFFSLSLFLSSVWICRWSVLFCSSALCTVPILELCEKRDKKLMLWLFRFRKGNWPDIWISQVFFFFIMFSVFRFVIYLTLIEKLFQQPPVEVFVLVKIPVTLIKGS